MKTAVVRGCGVREKAGVYSCCELSENGMPIESFLFDPPIPVDMEAMGLTAIGTQLRQTRGVWHILDWVGEQHYKNAADFIEETRRFGLSRRLSPNLEYKKLTPASRHILIHPRAYLKNYADYYKALGHPREKHQDINDRYLKGFAQDWCVKNIESHNEKLPLEMCASLWYDDLEGTETTVQMPSFTYRARTTPQGIKIDRAPAMFLQMPITHLTIIRDPKYHKDEESEAFVQPAVENGVKLVFEDE